MESQIKKLIFLLLLVSVSCAPLIPDTRLWKHGKVVFQFTNVSAANAQTFYEAAWVWNEATKDAVTFEDCTWKDTGDAARTLIIGEYEDCNSIVRIMTNVSDYDPESNMRMAINTCRGPVEVREMCHELGHVLGLDIHEFQRKDRDKWIHFDYSKFDDFDLIVFLQFVPETPRFYKIKDYTYDFISIMNYDRYTLQYFLASDPPAWMGDYPSPTDVKKIKNIYRDGGQMHYKGTAWPR